MVWTTLAMTSMGLSCIATGVTSYSLRRHWDLQVSCVRWLFFIFFASFCLYSAARVAYMVSVRTKATYDGVSDTFLVGNHLGPVTFAPLYLRVSYDPIVAAFLVIGDSIHFSVAAWTFPLIYELGLIATKTMDRGSEKEKEQIRWYMCSVSPIIAGFFIAETSLAACAGGYTRSTQAFQLTVYFTMFVSFLYMLFVILRLKFGGRKYENVQGQLVTSPVYQRISRILVIYAFFSLQYQLASVISYARPNDRDVLSNYTSVSTILYNISGLALAITTMCSQACILEMCRCCMPEDVEAHFEANIMQPGHLLSPRDTQVLVESAEPPLVNPVFVFTDIQESSTLWGIGDGLLMQRATEIHDNILRSLLMKYRGYEITTAGDAFQLAFHTIREAVEYSVDVQLQLLNAAWPKEMHQLLPATKKQRVGRHLIFRGLRVRMGIHDAVNSDGTLVLDVHAVTGRMTYTGASEVIANEIGDLADGGQILATTRVADWVNTYADLIAIPCSVDRVGDYTVPQIHAKVEVFQILPTELSKRKKKFATTFTSTLKRRSTLGSVATDLYSCSLVDDISPRMSSMAAERRRNLHALRERHRQLRQGSREHSTSHQALACSERAPHSTRAQVARVHQACNLRIEIPTS